MPSLFDPVAFGAIELANRIVMAPLTRARSNREAVPNALMAEYYAQRASAGLIISEATGISREGLGWPNAPGLWNDAQVEGWRPVTDAVHEAGGRIVAQLWHMGRLVHPDLGGGQPVSSSATTAPDFAHTYEGKKPYVEARAGSSATTPLPHAMRSAPVSTACRFMAPTAIWSTNSCATAPISVKTDMAGRSTTACAS
jgi:2,4-dienoyl-CoA reductase-like NADH-dependent reductase (Old Yellow Enzyme family)